MSDHPWTIPPGSLPPLPRRYKPRRKPKTPRAQKKKGGRPPGSGTSGSAPSEQMKPETITLLTHHNINDNHYGPGVVTVPRVVAQELLNREYQVRMSEARFRRDDIGVIIGARTAQGSIKTYEIPGALFDETYGRMNPTESISGKNSIDPGLAAGHNQF